MSSNNPDTNVASLGMRHWFPAVPDPPMREWTPAMLHLKLGADAAAYIVELRSDVKLWKALFNERASANVGDEHG
jgi:hypothetical protein